MRQFEAIIWDFGGVVTSSPFEAFARFEAEHGLPADIIRRINATDPDSNAWALFERAEISADHFDDLFAQEAATLGHDIRGRDVLALLSGDVRPRVVAALDQVKAAGHKIGCITNNVPAGKGAGMSATEEKAAEVRAIMARFDHVIESSKLGIRKPDPRIYQTCIRKPDPRIYQMMCETLAVEPARCIYLDDLGINCKPAATLGMTAIKVTGEAQALADLAALTGLAL